MFRRFKPIILLALTSCATTQFRRELQPPMAQMTGSYDEPESHLRIDTDRREVVVVAGPFHVMPTMMNAAGMMDHGGHDSSMKTPLVPLIWPVDGGLRGFRLGVFTGDGAPLPRSLVHHMNALNFDRRELLYPMPARLIAAGSETPDIKLPNSHQVMLERGDSLGWYIMWNNETGQVIEDVYVELVLPYGKMKKGQAPLTPIYLDTNLRVGDETSFNVPPGLSEHSYEFELPTGGKVLAAGGHVHDYGVEVRLEDVASGKVLFRLESDKDAEGRVSAVEQKIFRRFFNLFDASIKLIANHPYRIVGVYDNPTGETIPDGGMAQIGALFRPDDVSDWPANDLSDPAYQLDLSRLPAPMESHHH